MNTVLEWIAGYVLPALITVLTPIVLAGVKKAVDHMEKRLPKAMYPAVAPVLGALLEVIVGLQGVPGLPPGIGGALLGAAGVWLRELVDQVKQRFGGQSLKVGM